MHRVILALALALMACAPKVSAPTGFREQSTPIWSAAAFRPEAILGQWRQSAVFQSAETGCSGGQVDFAPSGNGLAISGTLCLDGKPKAVSGQVKATGPGRFQVMGEDWWVLWVDSGYRTLAIGTPSGRFGFVLDRGSIPSDRLEAAREVFDFNGYATGALRAL